MKNMLINNGFKQTGSSSKRLIIPSTKFSYVLPNELNQDREYRCSKPTLDYPSFSVTMGTIIKMSIVAESGREGQIAASEGISIPFPFIWIT